MCLGASREPLRLPLLSSRLLASDAARDADLCAGVGEVGGLCGADNHHRDGVRSLSKGRGATRIVTRAALHGGTPSVWSPHSYANSAWLYRVIVTVRQQIADRV